MKKDYELISFIQGSRRKAVLTCLKEKPKIPKQISDECKISISNVSNTLPELLEKSLIICKNPKSRVFKYYEITQKGKNLLNQKN
jgi:predicted transcriptional regulator